MATPAGSRFPASAGILIGLGIFLLVLNLAHNVHWWLVLARYWPLILILVGAGKLADYYWTRNHPERPSQGLGISTAWIAVLVLFGILAFHARGNADSSWNTIALQHEKKSVELQGAKAVAAHLQMPAGQLEIHGGAPALLNASFDYTDNEGQPQVNYNVSDNTGNLQITQDRSDHIHWGHHRNHWDIQLGNNAPIDLSLDMGAGQGDLNLRDVPLSRLEIHLGAGQLDLNLTGDRKANLPVDIEGGVGQATIRLPKTIGVLVHAHGGIGSIDTSGLEKDGDVYHNQAYGKSPVTMDLTVNGGVGQIELRTED